MLARAARGEHPHLHVNGADTIVFASRPVPGNEGIVREMREMLRLRGCRIVTHEDAPIHVSGHARADEVEELYGLVRPAFCMPVHGEREMLGRRTRGSRSPAPASTAARSCSPRTATSSS